MAKLTIRQIVYIIQNNIIRKALVVYIAETKGTTHKETITSKKQLQDIFENNNLFPSNIETNERVSVRYNLLFLQDDGSIRSIFEDEENIFVSPSEIINPNNIK